MMGFVLKTFLLLLYCKFEFRQIDDAYQSLIVTSSPQGLCGNTCTLDAYSAERVRRDR